MNSIFISLIILVILAVLVKTSTKSNKVLFINLGVLFTISTILILFSQPKLHKPISMEFTNYIIKFNSDGSMTTTKETTVNKVQFGENEE